MRLLLDAHIALWAIADDARLPAQAADDHRLARYSDTVIVV